MRIILCCLLSALVRVLPASAQAPDTLKHTLLPPPGVQSGAQLGTSVAVDGPFAVAGAPLDDVEAGNAGVVKVFDWATGSLLFVLPNPAPAVADRFGASVGIAGTLVVVGAPMDDTGAADAGSAYVFDLASATPTVPIAVFGNPSPAADDRFGTSVGISGTRIVVGAHLDDTGAMNAGSAYVFDLGSAAPALPVATLHNPGPGANDWFGWSVAISGTRVAVGAYFDDTGLENSGSAYVYDLAGPTPALPVAPLPNPGPAAQDFFGYSVGISGTMVIVGAYGDDTGASSAGSAYVFDIAGATPTVPVAALSNPGPAMDDLFGWSVAISGTRAVVGAYGDDTGASSAGSAYVYDIAGASPTMPEAVLNNPTPATNDRFGFAVSVSGTRVMAGASQDDTGAADAGSAYGFDLGGATPAVPAATFNHPGPAPGDYFGYSVAVSGTRVVVGAHYESTGAGYAGSAYVYDLGGATPSVPVAILNNPSPAVGDFFGYSVAISGARVVVGAYADSTGAIAGGSAYVYDLSSGAPTVPVVTLNNPSPTDYDFFGWSVAISGARVVVGTPGDDDGGISAGSAYVYDLNSATPAVPVATLHKPGPAALDVFGQSVAISGTRVVVGVDMDDTGATDAGSAYVYDLSSGTPTVPVVTLNNPDPQASDRFGNSVAISGPRVVVGAYLDDTGATDNGSAYVFDLESATPAVPVTTLHNPDPGYAAEFGRSVAISATQVVVGVPRASTGATGVGRGYVYNLGNATPTAPVATLNNPDGVAFDYFGWSVGIDGTTIAIGTPYDDTIVSGKGAAYIYGPDSTLPTGGTMTLTPASPVDAGAALTVDFAGWTDASLPLGYTVLIDDVIVSPAGPTVSRTITGPTASGAHILKGRIADAAGNVTEVMQNFTVLTPLESWRRLHFGIITDTGDAADNADPDGDGHDNAFEYVAGLVPTNPEARFRVRVDAVVGEPAQRAIVFSPLAAGRTYVVKCKASLADTAWLPLTSSAAMDNGTERTVTDLAAGAGPKFYIVEISMP